MDGDGPCAKMCNSFVVMIVGLVLFPLSLYLTGCNERSYVCTDKQIIYSDEHAETLSCKSDTVDAETFGFFSCAIDKTSYKTFSPCDFGIDEFCQQGGLDFKAASASQTVEMYQCKEQCETKKRKVNGHDEEYTTCHYSMAWQASKANMRYADDDSNQNKVQQACPDYFQNPDVDFPTNAPGGTQYQYVEELTVGEAYALPSDMIQLISPDSSPIRFRPLNNRFRQDDQQPPYSIQPDNVQVKGNYLTTCPQGRLKNGCVRISYTKNSATDVAVLAHVSPGDPAQLALENIPSSWLCPAEPLPLHLSFRAKQHSVSKDAMIAELHGENDFNVKLFRVICVLLAWIAVYMIFSPCQAGVDVVGDGISCIPCVGPWIADVIEGAATAIICCFSCSIGCSCALFVMGVVWIAMRPMVGVPMMIVACCLFGGGCAFTHSQKDAKARELEDFVEEGEPGPDMYIKIEA